MKKLYPLITLILLLTITFQANAQDGFDQLIRSSPGDATKLVQAYAEPLFKGFGQGLNSGWNNTAKTKKFLHFDLRITVNAAFVPTSDKSYDVTKIGLSNHVRPNDPSRTIAPTFAGDKNDGPVMNIYNDAGVKVSNFTLPKGIISVVPAPDIQLTIGLIQNTDLTIRTAPTIKISDDAGSVGMIGFGLKHDIIQDFLGNSHIPKPFDLAIAVNYSRINYKKTLDVQPDAGATPAAGQSSDFSNQRINSHFTGFNVQAIVSKKLLFFTPFFSVAYQISSTDFGVTGNYPITSTNPAQPNQYVTISDPVHIKETSVSGVRADVGFQLNLAVFRFYASYSIGQYQSVNGGIGFGF